jgi:glucose-6-phosphate 1-dehydrogenase
MNGSDLTPEEQALIEEKRKKQQEQKAMQDWQPRSLDSYTPEEKIAWFDDQYKSSLREFEEVKQRRFSNSDNAHYTWEVVMQLLAPKGDNQKFWNVWNYFVP